MFLIRTIEHGIAAVAHDILVGARATEKILTFVQKEAPAVEAITSLIDPRAVVIERLGVALLGELQPQVDKVSSVGTTLQGEAATPSFALSLELTQELRSLFLSLQPEIAAVKAMVAASAPK